jgi:conjugative transfer signal peptidase TraF
VKHALSGVLRGSPARALHVSCRSACSRNALRPVVVLPTVGVLLAAILAFALHVNLSASAPRGLYRTVTGLPTRGAWVVACVNAQSAALARARGYLGPGPCAGGVQPVLKRVVAVAGDVVEIGPEAVTVNGQRLPDSSTAASDSLGRDLQHVAWGRHVVGLDELWLVSTRVPNSWDSRYLGPFSTSQVWSVVRPVWTID